MFICVESMAVCMVRDACIESRNIWYFIKTVRMYGGGSLYLVGRYMLINHICLHVWRWMLYRICPYMVINHVCLHVWRGMPVSNMFIYGN